MVFVRCWKCRTWASISRTEHIGLTRLHQRYVCRRCLTKEATVQDRLVYSDQIQPGARETSEKEQTS